MSLCVTFLGTSGAVPTTQRNTSAVFVRREGDRLLFDCGEGTQRQMMRFGTGFAVSHVFVTHLHGDHVLGIPGLLQTMDFNERDDPIAVHVPAGTRREVERLVGATGTDPDFPVRVHGVEAGDVALSADDYEVRAFDTDHDARSVGYALVEDDRKGRFDRERAEELGVPVGPKFQRLHAGEAVELEDGTVVEPDQVVGDPRPGRTVVYTGDTRPTGATVEAAEDADLLIHDATFADDNAGRAGQTGHSTAASAAEIANRAGAERLALVHVSSRYAGNPTPLEREAREIFEGRRAFVPDDGDELDVPYPE
ncbi:ribonuclease Z [Natronomonas salina]|uniref:ribonuclease Z n=1 Tax=Natronomonas salina TaxID=1710540 RepID=UPI0015B546AC|nr:ribonuclease Z [Natronomonas salina]QLD88893.1 ribonuclease Z [Natronomonas salina]